MHLMPKMESHVARHVILLPILDTKEQRKKKGKKKVKAFEILHNSIRKWDYFGSFLSL